MGNLCKPVAFLLCTALLNTGLSSCEKQVELNDSEPTFGKVFLDHIGYFANGILTDDEGIICARVNLDVSDTSSDDDLSLIKYDRFGNREWERGFEINRRQWSEPGIAIARYIDGSYIISSRNSDDIIRIRENGEVLFHKTYRPFELGQLVTYFDAPYITGDGHIFMTTSNVTGSVDRVIYELDGEANIIKTTHIARADYTWSAFEILRISGDTILLSTVMRLGDPKVSKRGLLKIKRRSGTSFEYLEHKSLTDMDKQVHENPMYRRGTSGHEAYGPDAIYSIGIPQQYNTIDTRYNTWPNTFHVYKVDYNLNVLWDKPFDIGGQIVAVYNMQYAKDAGLYICGSIRKAGVTQAFAMKLDSEGEIEWQTINYPRTSSFWAVLESESTLAFVGSSKGHGSARETVILRPYLMYADHAGHQR